MTIEQPLPTANSATILIVDDEADNRDLLAQPFGKGEYRVVEAARGAEALTLARELLPDLILLDVMMPEMDGFEVTRRLRADPRVAEVPVILITALNDRESRLKGFDAGADEFISKPFDLIELRARVRTMTRLNRYGRLLRQRASAEEADHLIQEQASLIEAVPDAIVTLDTNGLVQSWNCGAETIFGTLADEAGGRPFSALISRGEDSARVESALAQTLRCGNWRGDLLAIRPDGVNVVAHSKWTLVRHPDGSSRGVLTVSTDVTEFKNLQSQFYRAQRLESLGMLAGGIAHDLNNILAPILMGTELLRKQPPDASILLDTIEASARRGASLVGQILSFTGGSDSDERVLIQPLHLVKDMVRMACETFPKAVEVTSQIPADLPCVRADATQLHQILLNLMVNARDAMPRGGSIVVSAATKLLEPAFTAQVPEARTGVYVVIQITDTGMGMSPEVLAKIWSPFFTTKPRGKGTGLGLATVAQLVKIHGGFVQVESQPAQGSTFSVFLPAELGASRASSVKIEPPAALPMGNAEQVLIVDDEVAVARIVETLLIEHNYRPTVANGPGPAFGAFGDGRRFDLALLDFSMPGMDGVRLAEAIQVVQPGLRIVLMSGTTHNPLTHETQGSFAGFLRKPFTAEELLRTMAMVLRTEAGSAAPP